MSIKSINDELVKLGRKPQCFRTLKQAQLALEAAKSGRAVKSSLSKPVMASKPAPAAKPVVVDDITSMRLAAKNARSAADKLAAYTKLSDRLNADWQAAKGDFARQAEIGRDLADAQKRAGYAGMAYNAENPNASKIQRYLDAADS